MPWPGGIDVADGEGVGAYVGVGERVGMGVALALRRFHRTRSANSMHSSVAIALTQVSRNTSGEPRTAQEQQPNH